MMHQHLKRPVAGLTLVLGLLLLVLTPLTVFGKPPDRPGNSGNTGNSGVSKPADRPGNSGTSGSGSGTGISDCGRGNNMNNRGNDSHMKELNCPTEGLKATKSPTATAIGTVTGTPTASANREPKECRLKGDVRGNDADDEDQNAQGDNNEDAPCVTVTPTATVTGTPTATVTGTPTATATREPKECRRKGDAQDDDEDQNAQGDDNEDVPCGTVTPTATVTGTPAATVTR